MLLLAWCSTSCNLLLVHFFFSLYFNEKKGSSSSFQKRPCVKLIQSSELLYCFFFHVKMPHGFLFFIASFTVHSSIVMDFFLPKKMIKFWRYEWFTCLQFIRPSFFFLKRRNCERWCGKPKVTGFCGMRYKTAVNNNGKIKLTNLPFTLERSTISNIKFMQSTHFHKTFI